jgi:hypothetical protein
MLGLDDQTFDRMAQQLDAKRAAHEHALQVKAIESRGSVTSRPSTSSSRTPRRGIAHGNGNVVSGSSTLPNPRRSDRPFSASSSRPISARDSPSMNHTNIHTYNNTNTTTLPNGQYDQHHQQPIRRGAPTNLILSLARPASSHLQLQPRPPSSSLLSSSKTIPIGAAASSAFPPQPLLSSTAPLPLPITPSMNVESTKRSSNTYQRPSSSRGGRSFLSFHQLRAATEAAEAQKAERSIAAATVWTG